jgi:hypothetical protein
MVRNEEKCCRVCCPLRCLLERQDRASTTHWIVAAPANTRAEVEEIAMDFVVGLPRTRFEYDLFGQLWTDWPW